MSSTTSLQQAIFHTLSYFGQFAYAPTLREIHQFLPMESTTHAIESSLNNSVKSGNILAFSFPSNISRYTLPQYSITKNTILNRLKTTEMKEKTLKKWVSLLKCVPGVRLIGLSGSVASYNAQSGDDIDLFIVTAHQRLWTVRAIVTVLLVILRKKRSRLATRAPDQFCLNLWFTESALQVPKHRQTEYSAYEVWRMRPVCSQHDTYQKFLMANQWTRHFLPNVMIPKAPPSPTTKKGTSLIDLIEQIVGFFQKKLIQRHRTTEFITETQLWFFPDDMQTRVNANTQKLQIRRNKKKKS